MTDYFGRYGGDELMWILTNATLDGARFRAEQLRDRFQNLRFTDLDPAIRTTLSVGVAQYRVNEDVGDTVHRADRALYEAKQAGRNRVVVADPAGGQSATARD